MTGNGFAPLNLTKPKSSSSSRESNRSGMLFNVCHLNVLIETFVECRKTKSKFAYLSTSTNTSTSNGFGISASILRGQLLERIGIFHSWVEFTEFCFDQCSITFSSIIGEYATATFSECSSWFHDTGITCGRIPGQVSTITSINDELSFWIDSRISKCFDGIFVCKSWCWQ